MEHWASSASFRGRLESHTLILKCFFLKNLLLFNSSCLHLLLLLFLHISQNVWCELGKGCFKGFGKLHVRWEENHFTGHLWGWNIRCAHWIWAASFQLFSSSRPFPDDYTTTRCSAPDTNAWVHPSGSAVEPYGGARAAFPEVQAQY